MEYVALIIVAIVALVLFVNTNTPKEKYLETSYYYAAAPGTRGERMVCTPENDNVSGLGVAVNQIVGGCPPAVPAMCQQYVKEPKAKITNYANSSKFIPITDLGDMPPAMYATIVDPSRPQMVVRPGRSVGKTRVVYRRIGDKVLPFTSIGGKWVQVKKNADGIWVKAPKKPQKPKVVYRRIGSKVLPFVKQNGKWVQVRKNPNGTWTRIKPKPKPKKPTRKPSKKPAKKPSKKKPTIVTVNGKQYMKKNNAWMRVKKVKGKWKVVSGAAVPRLKIKSGKVYVYKNKKWVLNKKKK